MLDGDVKGERARLRSYKGIGIFCVAAALVFVVSSLMNQVMKRSPGIRDR